MEKIERRAKRPYAQYYDEFRITNEAAIFFLKGKVICETNNHLILDLYHEYKRNIDEKIKYITDDKQMSTFHFDEIKYSTSYRFKQSPVSGNEWRISHKFEFLLNGSIMNKSPFWNEDDKFVEEIDDVLKNNNDLFNVYDDKNLFGKEDLCDQEGCNEKATVIYNMKMIYDINATYKTYVYLKIDEENIWIRKFCKDHSNRGDQGWEDCDENYELISGVIGQPKPKDKSQAIYFTLYATTKK